MWGWLSGIADWLKSIWEGISNISGKIVGGIGEFFSTLWDWLTDIFNAIGDLPELILDGIKSIFVPDGEKLKSDFNSMLSSISDSFGISLDGINEFKNSWQEKPTDNIEENYTIHGVGTLKLKFFDTSYLVQGVERFRPVIRGFVVLLLIFYNYYQVLSFIGQDPRIAHSAEKNAEAHLARKEK